VTFRAALINSCQNEFESLSSTLTFSAEALDGLDAEGVQALKKKRKDRVLANMRFIGQLFLRELLSAKIMGSVIQDLSTCDKADLFPEEPMVECICELLTTIGYTLDASPVGKKALSTVCSRLKELKSKGLYSKRIQFLIQDLLDLRQAGWARKTFKAAATTKHEVKMQQEKDLAASAWGLPKVDGELQIAGARPQYMLSH
jgi:hypothetical protein